MIMFGWPNRSKGAGAAGRTRLALGKNRLGIGIQFPENQLHCDFVRWSCFSLVVLVLGLRSATAQQTNVGPVSINLASTLVEAAGSVEVNRNGGTNWQQAPTGLLLMPGDRLRTRALSRAAVQLSDRSVIRLNESTTLELLPPRHAERWRFGLPGGSLYFFNREKPSTVEFDTPLAAGAIRGTEFLLEISAASPSLHLALLDGEVGLQTPAGDVSLQRGEDLLYFPGQVPRKTLLVHSAQNIQWALYYPAIISLEELQLDARGLSVLSDVIARYRAGSMLEALAVWPNTGAEQGSGFKILRAQLELAVGRVSEAETILTSLSNQPASAQALLELIAVVRGDTVDPSQVALRSASRELSESYRFQSRFDLRLALAAARFAANLAPQFGVAHARVAELEFAFGHHREASAELRVALGLSPRLASAHAIQGFVLLDRGDESGALMAFDHARELDAALGEAWLGRGLCLLRLRRFGEARISFQAAAALEPQRGLYRSYLGKAASEADDSRAAEKEFLLAKRLDPSDPTAWLYSALHLWQENRLNEAIRDLENSIALNDRRATFRSKLLLDNDRSVRSADLAALFSDAGLSEVSHRTASRSVTEEYANFSGHLFLANTLQELRANHFDLRLETARESELLVANLLAPAGAGNLSHVLSESDRLRFFDQRPVGLSSMTSYGSRGDWTQVSTVFGSERGFSYALDSVYESANGQRANNDLIQRSVVLTAKQETGPDDEAFFQIGSLRRKSGDLSDLYDPATASPGLRMDEKQEPDIYAGWHHTWSPGSHSLLLLSRLDDRSALFNPSSSQIFFVENGGTIQSVQSPPLGPAFTNDYSSRFILYSTDAQQILESEHHSLVFGGRLQVGRFDPTVDLTRDFSGLVAHQAGRGDFARGSTYGYYTWRPLVSLNLIGGLAYDTIRFPENTDFVPISLSERSRSQISPKVGILLTPWDRGLIRGTFTRSLGGLFFDNSIRIEPTQVAGFNQAFRSLIPESIAGLLPGAAFQTAGLGLDQTFSNGTFLGVEAERLSSDGNRTIGVLTNSFFLPIPNSPSSTRQSLDFRESNFSAYAAQLIGDWIAVSARYRYSEASINTGFPGIPESVAGLNRIEQQNRANLHQVTLSETLNHPSGLFGRWESLWSHQVNAGYSPGFAGSDFWQHNLLVGYRFSRRRAEITAGVLNLTDVDGRINPLNLHPELPRARTFVTTLRLNL